jgi:hypothetical protein
MGRDHRTSQGGCCAAPRRPSVQCCHSSALNEALGRLRRQRPTVELSTLDAESQDETHVIPFPLMAANCDPERAVARREIRHLMERAIDDLPEVFRIVFVMREIEELSVEETAGFLSLPQATSRPSTMPPPPSTRPSGSRGRRSSAFVRERHAPIDARGQPELSRLAGCVLSARRGQSGKLPMAPGIRCRMGFLTLGNIQQRDK